MAHTSPDQLPRPQQPYLDDSAPFTIFAAAGRVIGGRSHGDDIQAESSRLEALERDPQERGDVAGRSIHSEHRPTVLFRHSGWNVDRERVASSLARTDQPDSRRAAFADCGSQAFVLRSLDDPNKYRIAGSGCHDRFCLPCATERSRVIAHNVVELIEKREIRFVTLTIKSADVPLTESLSKLYTSFQRLRRRSVWYRAVFGGVAFLELTYNKSRQQWHPHLHCLVDGTWIDGKRMKTAWREITTDSYIVDIRLPASALAVARYVAKYASKPFNATILRDALRLDEAIVALKGRKLCLTYGRWRGKLLTASPSDGSWEMVCSLEHMISRAAGGNDECVQILQDLTGQDLGPILERAPPWLEPDRIPTKRDPQTTFFGTWQENGTFRHWLDPVDAN